MACGEIVDLGEWAEDKFSGLCSRAGVTRNKANQDRTGWDYLIEFRPVAMPDVPADLRPIEASARVQVKSKRAGKASVALKLSNTLRFAKEPLPCFVVLFLATKGSEPVRVFARHFWEQEINQALKRAREAHAEGRDDLNKLTTTLSFGLQDEHGSDLTAWMAATIAEHGDRYADAKADLVRTLGFEDGSIHGNIRFNVADIGALVDHQIGLTAAAPALNITIRERRFGVDTLTPLFEGVPDFARLQSHPRPCRVRVRGLTDDDVWLDGKLFVPGLPNLPIEFCKLRVVADFIEIVISGTSTGEVTFNLDRSTHRSLAGLRALANVLRAAKEGPLQFQISSDGKALTPFAVSMPGERSGEGIQQVSNVIACLEKASTGLLPPELTLSLGEIDHAWNAIVAFNGMVTGTNMKCRFTIRHEIPAVVGAAVSIFLYDYVDIGDWTFMAVVRRPILKFEIRRTEGSLECGPPRVVEAIVRRGTGNDHLAKIREFYAEACKIEQDGVLELYGGDYRAMMAGTSANLVPRSVE
jgi:hypothetical protein